MLTISIEVILGPSKLENDPESKPRAGVNACKKNLFQIRFQEHKPIVSNFIIGTELRKIKSYNLFKYFNTFIIFIKFYVPENISAHLFSSHLLAWIPMLVF